MFMRYCHTPLTILLLTKVLEEVVMLFSCQAINIFYNSVSVEEKVNETMMMIMANPDLIHRMHKINGGLIIILLSKC